MKWVDLVVYQRVYPHRHHHWGRRKFCTGGSGVDYDRAVLVDVLVYHYRDDIKGCGCGWAELGRSWPEHVADVYEQSVWARS